MRKKIFIFGVAMLFLFTAFAGASVLEKNLAENDEGKYFKVTVLKLDGTPAKNIQVTRRCYDVTNWEVGHFTDENGVVWFDENHPVPPDAEVTFFAFHSFPPTTLLCTKKDHEGSYTGQVDITVDLPTNDAKNQALFSKISFLRLSLFRFINNRIIS